MVYGKLVGGLIGLLVGGVIGLLVGVIVGHAFDRGLTQTLRQGSPENIELIKASFFETTFMLLGHIAKSDGQISKHEIDHTEQIIRQMGLAVQQRQRAIELFRRGADAQFNLEAAVVSFMDQCGNQHHLKQTLLLFLITLALADQRLEPGEHAALVRIANLLELGAMKLEQLLRMAQAQEHFHSGDHFEPQPGASLTDAYAALGVDSNVDDKTLKRAYRKLMSENHPDKLIAQGVPDDMVKLATERSQEIQAAYEMIRKERGLKK